MSLSLPKTRQRESSRENMFGKQYDFKLHVRNSIYKFYHGQDYNDVLLQSSNNVKISNIENSLAESDD